MRILSRNIHGLKRKLGDTDFLQYVSDYDIVFLSETWHSKTETLNIDFLDSVANLFPEINPETRHEDDTAEVSQCTTKTTLKIMFLL